jgi:sugar lactone lactonase YvrE
MTGVSAQPSTAEVRVVVEGLRFPEGPRWHDGRFWFSDIHGHRVHTLTPEGELDTVVELDDRPSGLGFLPTGELLISSMLDRVLLRLGHDGQLSVHSDISDLTSGFINDMVVDAKGRAYVGSRNGGPPGTDSVILVHPDGRAEVAIPAITSPNGTVVTPDGSSIIIAQTHIGRLTRYAVGDDGSLTDPVPFAEREGVHFDGVCLDEDGMIWSGGGHGLIRVAPGGRIDRDISIGHEPFHAVACVLGGHERRTMMLAMAHTTPNTFTYVGLDRTKDATTDARGMIAFVELDVRGAGLP